MKSLTSPRQSVRKCNNPSQAYYIVQNKLERLLRQPQLSTITRYDNTEGSTRLSYYYRRFSSQFPTHFSKQIITGNGPATYTTLIVDVVYRKFKLIVLSSHDTGIFTIVDIKISSVYSLLSGKY